MPPRAPRTCPFAATAALALCWALLRAGPVRADAAGLDTCIRAHEDAQLARQSQALLRAEGASLRCAQADCPASLRSECLALHEAVLSSLPSLVFVVRSSDGRDLPQAHVSLGQALDLAGIDGRAHPVDPGVYTLRISAPGFLPYEHELVVHTAEHERVLRVELAPLPALQSGSSARPAAFTLLGVGAATLAVGAGFGITGLVQKGCAHTCTDAEASAVRRNLLLADVLAPAGGALLLAGLLLRWWPSHGARAKPAKLALRPMLVGSFSSLGVVGHGAF